MKFKIILFLCLFFTIPVFAWGPQGHRTIAAIAEKKLSLKAQKAIELMIGKKSLVDIASWADSIRSIKEYRKTIWYHFEKIPDGVSFIENLKLMPDWQRKKGSLISMLLLSSHILRKKSSSKHEKIIALKFLVHLVGDIHQPLHTGRPQDKGGITIRLNWFGKFMNLHRVWDSAMIIGHPNITRKSKKFYIDYAHYLTHQFSKKSICPKIDFEKWLYESMALRLKAYDSIYISNQKKYLAQHLPNVDLQIYTAGLRLAYLLNSIFQNELPSSNEKKLWQKIENVIGPIGKIIDFKQFQYPAKWWKSIPRKHAASWEILPQDAKQGEVILSKRTELGILSNFANTPFVYRGKKYASVEGFWQMMKYPEGMNDKRIQNPKIKWAYTRDQVANMSGFKAKKAGRKANKNMRKLGIKWVTFEGRKINYLESKSEFYHLILDVQWAKLKQNRQVREILLKTDYLKLMPDHHQYPNSPQAWKYNEIWMKIRSKLLK